MGRGRHASGALPGSAAAPRVARTALRAGRAPTGANRRPVGWSEARGWPADEPLLAGHRWNLKRGALLFIASALSADAQARWCVSELWEYELYGGAQLAPHRLYVFARFLTHAPEKGVGVGRPPRNGPPPSEHEV
eukprot:scaffold1487_cov116-Isochrysis_galbana.AAC.8